VDLRGKVAIVTGAAGEIGSASAAALLEAGAAVVLNGRNAARCEAAAEGLRRGQPDSRLAVFDADVSDYEDCVALVAHAEAAFGRVDVLIHCALSPIVGLAGPFEGTDPDKYEALMRQAVCALMYLSRAVLPAMRRAGGGAMVAFPSDAGKAAAPNQTMVGATRAAVMMFMRSLALEASRDGVRCNCIAPTYVDSPRMREAMGDSVHGPRIAKAAARAKLGLPTAAELAALAVFLCGPAGAHLTGQVISVNGGLQAA
jgi:NAD(P)-dependent dehydrogenase (short-subunit alcohol dehydrogenase family)